MGWGWGGIRMGWGWGGDGMGMEWVGDGNGNGNGVIQHEMGMGMGWDQDRVGSGWGWGGDGVEMGSSHILTPQRGSNYGSLMTAEGQFQVYAKTAYYKVWGHGSGAGDPHPSGHPPPHPSSGQPGGHQAPQPQADRADAQGPVRAEARRWGWGGPGVPAVGQSPTHTSLPPRCETSKTNT